MLTRSSFPRDLTEGLNAHFGMEYRNYPNETDKVFDTYTSNKAFEEDVLMTGFGPAPIKGEGESYAEDDARQGWSARYNMITVAMKFGVTQEALEDNLYMQLGSRYAKSLARSMNETQQVIGTNVLNRAFNSSFKGGDGKELLATDHPTLYSGTYSNELAVPADLSETALEDIAIMIRTCTDDRGLPIALRPKLLIIPPQLEFVAARLLRTEMRPGTNENDINAIKSLGVFPTAPWVMTRLTDSSAWFCKTDCMDGLKFFNRKALERGSSEDEDTGTLWFRARSRFAYGFSDPRGLFGSPGVA